MLDEAFVASTLRLPLQRGDRRRELILTLNFIEPVQQEIARSLDLAERAVWLPRSRWGNGSWPFYP